MNTADVIWRVAQLSSLPFQERYVIGGTSDEYIIPEELFENVEVLKYSLSKPSECADFTASQLTCLKALIDYIETVSGEALSGNSREDTVFLIRRSNVWNEMRSKAAFTLNAFGVSAELTVEEIDRMSE